jgi:MoaA/NifB/PqqE/SkfB family radical SAM enzyme
MLKDNELKGFCAAPWVEAVLYHNGSVLTCCNNFTIFGNWREELLQECWLNKSFQNFRKYIADGNFPDENCKICYDNGRVHHLHGMLIRPFTQYKNTVFEFLGKELSEISKIEAQFNLKRFNAESNKVFEQYFSTINTIESELSIQQTDIITAVKKLVVIGRIAKAYLEGDLTPPIVAPLRQPQLISKCNARCIQCPGLYSGEILYSPALNKSDEEQLFAHEDDIIDFVMMGSEFLLYKEWKRIADNLVSQGVKLSLSTNGILLTPSNIRYLIDNNILHYLNISMDGATKETLETIRVNVKFEKLIENIRFLFHYAHEKQSSFTVSFTFVIMKRNYRELPELIRLIDGIREENRQLNVQILCHALTDFNNTKYRNFVKIEHHTLIKKYDLNAIFKKVYTISTETNIPVSIFGSYDLDSFIESGCPVPPLPDPIKKLNDNSKVTKLSNTSPILEPHTTIDPHAFVATIANNTKIKIEPVLNIPQEDQGKSVELYAVVVIDNSTCYIASPDGPFDRISWKVYYDPLEMLIFNNKLTSFVSTTLKEKQIFKLGLHDINIGTLCGVADVYYGYNTGTLYSTFVGAAYRLVIELR